ncbi:MAG: hypothetical protein WBW32_08410 [Luteibacter sp.]
MAVECGNAPDPRTVAAKGLKSHYYQDEYIAGFDQQIASNWNWGAKATWRQLRSAIDDTCTPALKEHLRRIGHPPRCDRITPQIAPGSPPGAFFRNFS